MSWTHRGPNESLAVIESFSPLLNRLQEVERLHNSKGENLHFRVKLSQPPPDVWNVLLPLARDGLHAIRAHRSFFERHSLYADGMFWYNLHLWIRAVGENLRRTNTAGAVQPGEVMEMVDILIGCAEFTASTPSDARKRNQEALAGVLWGFFDRRLVQHARTKAAGFNHDVATFVDETIQWVEGLRPLQQ